MDAELEAVFADYRAAMVRAAVWQTANRWTNRALIAAGLIGFFLTALLFAEWLRYPETAVLTMIFGGY